jgi:hypothetical protein
LLAVCTVLLHVTAVVLLDEAVTCGVGRLVSSAAALTSSINPAGTCMSFFSNAAVLQAAFAVR